jgi:uncharacterized protein (TIGR02594 family)
MKTDLLEIALSQYGIKEVIGQVNNKKIVDYFKEIGHPEVKDDETAWCSAFVNWVAMKAGYHFTGKLNARSWLDIGTPTTTPEQGDVVILKRANDPQSGHVGFFINQDAYYIYMLGGNQGNQVNITPFHKDNLLGYRQLTKK